MLYQLFLLMGIEEMKSILVQLHEAQDRFKAAVEESDLPEVYIDQFEEKMRELAHMVGEAIRETERQRRYLLDIPMAEDT